HALAPPPGFVDVAIVPRCPTATHNELDGQEIAVSSCVVIVARLQASAAPVGLDEVRTLPASSTAAQKVVVGQSMLRSWTGRAKAESMAFAGADHVKGSSARAADGATANSRISRPARRSGTGAIITSRTGARNHAAAVWTIGYSPYERPMTSSMISSVPAPIRF